MHLRKKLREAMCDMLTLRTRARMMQYQGRLTQHAGNECSHQLLSGPLRSREYAPTAASLPQARLGNDPLTGSSRVQTQ